MYTLYKSRVVSSTESKYCSRKALITDHPILLIRICNSYRSTDLQRTEISKETDVRLFLPCPVRKKEVRGGRSRIQYSFLKVHHFHFERFTLKHVRDNFRYGRCTVVVVVAIHILILLGEVFETIVILVQLKKARSLPLLAGCHVLSCSNRERTIATKAVRDPSGTQETSQGVFFC